MSRTYRRKTGDQPAFRPSFRILWEIRKGMDIQVGYDIAKQEHVDWCRRYGRDGLSETGRNKPLKHATTRDNRTQWRRDLAKGKRLGFFDENFYDCGCDWCEEQLTEMPYHDVEPYEKNRVSRWAYF